MFMFALQKKISKTNYN